MHSVQEQQQTRKEEQLSNSSGLQLNASGGTTDWYHDRLPTHFQKDWTRLDLTVGTAQYYYKRKAECSVLEAYYIYSVYYYIYCRLWERRMSEERERKICMQQQQRWSKVLTHCVRRNGNYIYAGHRGAATADLTDWLTGSLLCELICCWKQHRTQSLSDALCMLDAVKSPRQKKEGVV